MEFYTPPSSSRGISLKNLFLIIGVGLLLILLWELRGLLVSLMIAVVLTATLAPIVNRAEALRLPRWLAVIVVFLGLISMTVGVILLIGPTVIQQIERLIRLLPNYLDVLATTAEDIAVRLGADEPETLAMITRFFDLQSLTSWAFRSGQQVLVRSLGVTRGLVGGVLNLILALLFSGYMLSGAQSLIRGIVQLFPHPWNQRIEAQITPAGRRMGSYIQGRILVSSILAIAVTFGLRLVGVSELALGLGAIAGITNLIPFFGPVLGSIPALIVAVAQGGWTFVWVLLLFVIIQNLETYVLDPLLVGSSVRVSPLYQLLAVLGGAQVLGIVGALIVPPWVAGANVFIEKLYIEPKLAAEAALVTKPVLESLPSSETR
ncbi:MAG: AI-2E family transporter [Cyanobacteria bacterium P01_H01_bin.15]